MAQLLAQGVGGLQMRGNLLRRGLRPLRPRRVVGQFADAPQTLRDGFDQGDKSFLRNRFDQHGLGQRQLGGLGLHLRVGKGEAVMLGQRLRVPAAVGDELVAIGRRAVRGRAHQVGHQVHVIAAQNLRQGRAQQSAVRVIGLVKVVQGMARAARLALSLGLGAQLEQALTGQQALADHRHQQGFERHHQKYSVHWCIVEINVAPSPGESLQG